MGKGGSSTSTNVTENNVDIDIKNIIDTEVFAQALTASSKMFADLTKQGQTSINNLNKTFKGLISQGEKRDAIKTVNTNNSIKVLGFVIGAGLAYFILRDRMKLKKSKGKK